MPSKLATTLLLAGWSSILLSAETCAAFPPSSFRFRSRSISSLSRASVPLSTFEAIDTLTSVAADSKLRYHCPTAIYSSSTSADTKEEEKKNSIRPYLKQLFLLCRPINFPVVFLFHVLGVHRAVEFWKMTMQPVSTSSSSSMLVSLLKEPSMMMVLLALMLVTSTSMITNDYYDAKTGVDVVPDTNNETNDEYEHYHPLAEGKVPFTVTKTFVSVSRNTYPLCRLLRNST
jgi:hypothetical protein